MGPNLACLAPLENGRRPARRRMIEGADLLVEVEVEVEVDLLSEADNPHCRGLGRRGRPPRQAEDFLERFGQLQPRRQPLDLNKKLPEPRNRPLQPSEKL